MKPAHKKLLILTLKLAVAAALLVMIFSKVHWNNYVILKSDGSAHVVQSVTDAGVVIDNDRERSIPFPDPLPFSALESTTNPDGTEEFVRPGFKSSLLSIHKGFVLAGVGVYFLSMIVPSIRWWYMLRIQGLNITMWAAIKLSFLGRFFDNVMPGTVGGDVFKAWHVGKQTNHKAGALLSVLADRGAGTLGLATTAGIMLAFTLLTGMDTFDRLRVPAIAIMIAFTGMIVACAFLFSPRLRRVCRIQKLYSRTSIAHHFEAAGQAAMAYQQNPRKLIVALLLAWLGQFFFISSFMLLGMGLGLPTPWFSYFLYIPIIYIIGAVPLTPGGIGIIEGLFVALFAVGASSVMVLALMGRLLPLFLSLPGLIVFLMSPKIPDAETLRHEMEDAVDED